MERPTRPTRPTKWTELAIREEALKYSTRNEFNKKSNGAYYGARRLGILEDVTAHMERPTRPTRPTKWTELAIREEALKYSTRNEFKKASNGAYTAARRLGIYEEVTSHMVCGAKVASYKNRKWTEQVIREEALNIPKSEFCIRFSIYSS